MQNRGGLTKLEVLHCKPDQIAIRACFPGHAFRLLEYGYDSPFASCLKILEKMRITR